MSFTKSVSSYNMTFATYDVISHDHHHEHPTVAKFCRNEPRKDITARKKGFLTQKVNSKKILRKSLSLRRNVCYVTIAVSCLDFQKSPSSDRRLWSAASRPKKAGFARQEVEL